MPVAPGTFDRFGDQKCRPVQFRHVWQESEAPVFNTYLWHDENAKIIQAFGQQAKGVNGLGMLAPLQYFCVFNAKTGEVIAASFE
ncbi:TPA: hypothetical protein MRP47_001794 [Escherichia coli]|nr:hypothetical protein [Escherichia coli]EII2308240.1 hypothetical protein [Escherichia coli]EJQ6193462.1 hypothetical protein [Escherichia coli]EJZ2706088.1 hypothetical protein [Escherichia coli]HAG7880232.1 hypothetical protein [Escherichia coli]